ncbi:hypothetical protein JOF56_011638 [Kibdelosporangium banguiense]|uniref:Uncharacterized protein n=1 Tax=Kibdelosporangium banguiense TaxID=1365924 RepID=A0ABS4U4X2_9PSEU|nr:hypothetical protein [Kibdelosporangium banguiense]MBP2331253.1 hypothetical protein [Kibdelosporangium banguiense]
MPERTVLQRAANVARLLGDTNHAEAFADADQNHQAGGVCAAGLSGRTCPVEQLAHSYLDEHTDGDNIVMHIGPTDEQARRLDKARSIFDKFRDDLQLAAIAQLTDQNRMLRNDLDGRVRALAVALGTKPDNTPTGGLYRMCQEVADMRNERDLLLWLHAEAVHERDVAKVDAAIEISADEWRAALDAYRDLLGCIWLYVNWRYVTKQLETVQKDLWADAVDQFGDPDERRPGKADRWWRDDSPAEPRTWRDREGSIWRPNPNGTYTAYEPFDGQPCAPVGEYCHWHLGRVERELGPLTAVTEEADRG